MSFLLISINFSLVDKFSFRKKVWKPETMFTNSDGSLDVLNPNNLRASDNIYEAARMSIEEGLGHGPSPSEDGPKSGELSTQFNIMNTVMGVAILSLPNVFYVTGIVPGIIGMV
jgi:hypothetical protein